MNRNNEIVAVLRQALEALEDIFGKNKVDVGVINVLRKAIKEAEQEKFCDNNCVWTDHNDKCIRSNKQEPVAFIDERGNLQHYKPSDFNQCEYGGLTRLYTKEQP